MRICFVLQSVSIGGGTYAVLQHADHLSRHGHDVSIVSVDPVDADARAWHPSLRVLPCLRVEQALILEFDVAIATFWTSVEPMLRLRATHRAHFVQSIESRFYPRRHSDLRAAVRDTYALSLPVITEAKWIEDHLVREHGTRVWLARNGIDKAVFDTAGPLESPRRADGLRVLVEGPLGVGFKNVPRTIRLARRSHAAEVWLLTSSSIDSYPGVDRVFSRVPMTRAADIYRSCDVLLKLSLVEGMFGPPLEMFCCGGTAVVYKVSGFDEYVVPSVNALACDVGDEPAVLEALRTLGSDAGLLDRLKTGAEATGARWPDWSQASSRFSECLDEIVRTPPYRAPDRVRHPNTRPQRVALRAGQTAWARLKRAALGMRPVRRAVTALRVRWFAHVESRFTPETYGD